MSARKRLTQEVVDEIWELARAGARPPDIAKKIGFSLPLVYRTIHDYYRRKKVDALAQKVAELRKKKMWIRNIAKTLKISEVAVRRYLRLAYLKKYITFEEANSLSVKRFVQQLVREGESNGKEKS